MIILAFVTGAVIFMSGILTGAVLVQNTYNKVLSNGSE